MLKRRLLLYCIALCLCSGLKPQPVFAETLFEDNFDDGVLDDWTVTRNFSWGDMTVPCYYQGQPAIWQILLQRLGIRIDGQGCFSEIVPTTFRIPPNQGYVFEFDMTMPQSTHMDRSYTIKFIDVDHTYVVIMMDNRVTLAKGVANVLPITNNGGVYPFEAGGTYHIRNEFGADNSIRIYINETLVIDTIDLPPFFTGGTIGFQGSVGAIPSSEVWFDNVKVSTIADPRDIQLDVPYYSQRDPAWAGELYDSADDWAGKDQHSIERWGCALTSAAMLLRFHNITSISSNIPLTPQTLNTWLRDQSDGYVGNGLVNWIALTRLTKQFNRAHPDVPALEYSYAGMSPAIARQELENQRPFIVNLPNHFVVARGIQHADDSLLVHDPLDAQRTSLSSSTQISSRLFKPSFTDLSYILAVHDTDTVVEIVGLDGAQVPSYEETIEDDLGLASMTSSTIHHVAKPEDGTYTITVQSSSASTYTLDLYFYDTDGEVQHEMVNGNSTQLPVQYAVTYVNGGTTTLTRLQSRFINELKQAYQHHEISSAYAYYAILKIAEYRETAANDAEDARYARYLQQLLETYTHTFSSGTKERLEALL